MVKFCSIQASKNCQSQEIKMETYLNIPTLDILLHQIETRLKIFSVKTQKFQLMLV